MAGYGFKRVLPAGLFLGSEQVPANSAETPGSRCDWPRSPPAHPSEMANRCFCILAFGD